MDLKAIIDQEVENWERVGHPALLQRFVQRKGRAFEPPKKLVERMEPNECFANATLYVQRFGGTYVEGFTVIENIEFLVHHAWVVLDDGEIVEPTLSDGGLGHRYFGVSFETELLMREIIKNRVYGLLDTGRGLNADLMFRLDPGLKPIVETITNTRRGI